MGGKKSSTVGVHARRPTNRVSPEAIVHSAKIDQINLKSVTGVNFLRRNPTKNWGHTGFVKKRSLSEEVKHRGLQVVNFFLLG